QGLAPEAQGVELTRGDVAAHGLRRDRDGVGLFGQRHELAGDGGSHGLLLGRRWPACRTHPPRPPSIREWPPASAASPAPEVRRRRLGEPLGTNMASGVASIARDDATESN